MRLGGDLITGNQILRFTAVRYQGRSLVFPPPPVAAEVLKKPEDFIRAAKGYSEPELNF